jgi:hypothetical protein
VTLYASTLKGTTTAAVAVPSSAGTSAVTEESAEGSDAPTDTQAESPVEDAAKGEDDPVGE